MKRAAPRLSPERSELSLSEVAQRAIFEGEPIEGMEFERELLSDVSCTELEFSGCRFRNVQFTSLEIQRIHFCDCAFEHCDLSGVPFRDGTILRSAFTDCRLTGCSFDRMLLRDALFSDCTLNTPRFPIVNSSASPSRAVI